MKFSKGKKRKKLIHLIAHMNPMLPITEQYRQIRTSIQFSSVDKTIKSIMLASAQSGEGKSTTASNLAIVLAQQGNQVLLVDADLRKPSIHYAFRVSNIDGLTNVLTKEVELDRAIKQTDIHNLSLLTSGAKPPNPSEILSSNSMETLMGKLKEMFDFVIYDTPPALAVTDSQVLANKCDGVILVVASGKTNRELALKSLDVLKQARAHILGAVVNGIELSKKEYYREYK
ncbi:CpsD/CapB family tyrosine-protein kinase [Cytobacillus solani]|uniref:CpsD/CapB family tyrosine-protein kinase n=1 Tax=Cytobacillus solani TaxID=1637975 RepID=UPI0020793826|nr:CpsD/CapB family tyrosine-protein kinase [Cytobacillus solani]USK55793.1 CpsD/CapB family tyrosine-protein kinase [Cytobacillus solani]